MSSRPLSRLASTLIAGLLCCTASPALGEPTYEWTDAAGHLHYGDSPPPGVKYRLAADRSAESVPDALEPGAPADPARGWSVALDGPGKSIALKLPRTWQQMSDASLQQLVRLNPWVDAAFLYTRVSGERPTVLMIGDQPAGLLARAYLEELRKNPKELRSFASTMVDKLGAKFESARYDTGHDVVWCEASAGEFRFDLAFIPSATGVVVLSGMYPPGVDPSVRPALRSIVESYALSPGLSYPAPVQPQSSGAPQSPPPQGARGVTILAELCFVLAVVGALVRKRSRRSARRVV